MPARKYLKKTIYALAVSVPTALAIYYAVDNHNKREQIISLGNNYFIGRMIEKKICHAPNDTSLSTLLEEISDSTVNILMYNKMTTRELENIKEKCESLVLK